MVIIIWRKNSDGTMKYHFNQKSPVEPWTHMAFSKQEMRRYLEGRHSPADTDGCMTAFYEAPQINRKPPSEIINKFRLEFDDVSFIRTLTQIAPNEYYLRARQFCSHEDLTLAGMTVIGSCR